MNIICDKTLLSAAIDGVSKAVTLRSTIPVLEGILLKAEGFQLTLTGYDLEMGIVTTIEANVKEPGEIVLTYNGSAEENFGRILDRGMREYRDELCISTKAGYEMWDGPYGDRNGSRKYLISSLDQSLKRMKLDYVDIYYHHIYDPETPLEETALALDSIVKQGKALYVGISNYNRENTEKIQNIFRELKTPFVINQPSYSMLNRWIEADKLDEYALENGIGLSIFSPLYQGFLTGKYLNGVPSDSRVGKGATWIGNELNEKMLSRLNKLNNIAAERGQTLAQTALSWVLHNKAVTTVIIGASRPQQIIENAECVKHLDFSDEEIRKIEAVLAE